MVCGENSLDSSAAPVAKVIRYSAVNVVAPAGTFHCAAMPLSTLVVSMTLDRLPLPVGQVAVEETSVPRQICRGG